MQKKELVLSRTQIEERVKELAEEITEDYKGRSPILIGILKGAFIFLADLARQIKLPVKIDFVRLVSYGEKDYSDGNVRLTKDVELPIKGEDIIVVEDIVDSGYTIAFLLKHLARREPASLKVCALIDKSERREIEVKIDYVGFKASGFLVGYGLDFNEQYRCLPEIYTLD
ncbi:MAG: hypoxanthine phosphoribosyltransferase [Candidatus Desulfofervidaceae bacterium]|nr:hypoxanthine phosphoribosyltransferase [Candidatus Desulfofervidaceae bacterium]MDL1969945.1 hypoxanthine phosphoribosyltransferase [Candidatus Desulfofervidaceae bacterium]